MAKRSKTFSYPFARPAVTVDIALFTVQEAQGRVLLIQRAKEPMQGDWAFPGGFVDEGEDLPEAACRELREETGITLSASRLFQFGAFGEPGRDPRGWTISVGFYGVVAPDEFHPKAEDDAKAVAWKSMNRPPKLAFDHKKVLKQAISQLRQDYCVKPVLKPFFGNRAFTVADIESLMKSLDPRFELHGPRLRKRLLENGVIKRVQDLRSAKYTM